MIRVIDEHHLHVGNQVWWGTFRNQDTEAPTGWKFRQFLVHFESKWAVSVIWGYASNSDNHDLPWYEPEREFNETPDLIEAAVLHSDRDGIQGGDVFSYIDDEQLNALLAHVSSLSTTDHFHSDRTETYSGEA